METEPHRPELVFPPFVFFFHDDLPRYVVAFFNTIVILPYAPAGLERFLRRLEPLFWIIKFTIKNFFCLLFFAYIYLFLIFLHHSLSFSCRFTSSNKF